MREREEEYTNNFLYTRKRARCPLERLLTNRDRASLTEIVVDRSIPRNVMLSWNFAIARFPRRTVLRILEKNQDDPELPNYRASLITNGNVPRVFTRGGKLSMCGTREINYSMADERRSS